MKKTIHPKWYPEARVTCICGNTFTVGSTQEEIMINVCSKCHPFFTGEQKFIDTEGRVEKFRKRQKIGEEKRKILTQAKKKKVTKEKERPKTLREMLLGRKL